MGNTHVVFGGHSSGKTELIQQTDYYPYGLVMAQQEYIAYEELPDHEVLKNKYLYNGKEWQDDNIGNVKLDWYDYGARMYDPELGRWHSVDPLTENYFDSSPYCYVANNPLVFIDPDGMRLNLSILDKDDKNYNQENADAFLAFAQTKFGKQFLSYFAEEGQGIEGTNIEFSENGAFHEIGIDLGYSSSAFTEYGPNGKTILTSPEVNENGRWNIEVQINSDINSATNNTAATDYINNKNSTEARDNYIASRAATIVHESGMHVNSYASKIQETPDIARKIANGETYNDMYSYRRYYGYQDHVNARKPNSFFRRVGLPTIISIYRRLGSKKSKEQIENEVFKFRD